MPRISDDALCIRHWDWSESSQTVSLFGREHGLLRGLAKGARRSHGSFGGGLDLFSRGQVLAAGRAVAGGGLLTLTEWTMAEAYPRLRLDLAANRAAFYIADLLQRLMPPHDPHPRLFDEAVLALRRLDAADAAPPVLARFQWAILDAAGYRPQMPAAEGSRGSRWTFSADLGRIAPGDGEGSRRWRVRSETAATLQRIAEAFDLASPESAADAEAIDRVGRLLAAYLREILGEEPLTMRQCYPKLPAR